MKLWSLHPRYLDRVGLIGAWREVIVIKRLLLKEHVSEYAKKYINFRDVNQFMDVGVRSWKTDTLLAVYLWSVYEEGIKRGYKFNANLMFPINSKPNRKELGLTIAIPITTGQLNYELRLFLEKVRYRDPEWMQKNWFYLNTVIPEPNPVFRIVWGGLDQEKNYKVKLKHIFNQELK